MKKSLRLRSRGVSQILSELIITQDIHSPVLLYACEFLSQIQIFVNLLLFTKHFSTLRPSDYFIKSLTDVLQVFSFTQKAIDASFLFSARDLLFLAFLAYVIILYIFLFGAITYSYLKGTSSSLCNRITTNLFHVHSKVMFMATSAIFLSAIDHPTGEITTFSSKLAPAISILLLFNLLPALVFSFFSYQPMMKNYLFSHRPTSLDFLDLLFKVFCLFFIEVYKHWESAKLCFYALALGIETLKLYIILRANPFYIHKGYKILVWAISFHFSIALLSTFFVFWGQGESYDPLFLVILTSPIIAKFINEVAKPDFQKILVKNPTTNHEANLKISTLVYILNFSSYQSTSVNSTSFQREEFAFMGIVKQHTKTCLDQKCYCKIFHGQKDQPYQDIKLSSDVEARLKDFQFNLLREVYQEILGSEVKNNSWLMIDFINMLMTARPRAFPVALSLIHGMKLEKLGYIERYIMMGLLDKVREQINIKISLNSEQLDANNFFEFRSQAQEFKQNLAFSTRQVLTFWRLYKDTKPLFMNLYNISIGVQAEFEAISRKWNNLRKHHKGMLIREYRLYSSFLAIVQNSPKESRDLLFEMNNFIMNKLGNNSSLDKITKETIRDERNIIIGISMSKSRLGTIIQISPNAEASLEWQTFDLLNNSINNIIPTFLRDFHTQSLINHLEFGTNNLILKNQTVFVQKKSGFIVPCQLYVSPQADLNNDLTYIGIIRPVKQHSEYVILSQNDEILACTPDVGREMNFVPVKTASGLKEHYNSFHMSYSLETLSHHELMERSGGKCSIEGQNENLVLCLKSGVFYTCTYDNQSFVRMLDSKIYKLDKFYNKHHKSKKSEEPDLEVTISQEIDDKYIRNIDAINLHIGKYSDTQICSKSTFLPPKDDYFDEPQPIEIPKINERKLSQIDEDVCSENLKSSSDIPSSLKSKDGEDLFKYYEDSCQTSSVASRKSSKWREMHEVDITIREKPKASKLKILTLSIITYLALVLGGTMGANSFASDMVNTNGEIANIMRDSTLRLYYFLELHRRSRMMMLIAQGQVSNTVTLPYITISNYMKLQLNFTSNLTTTFAKLNNILGEHIYILDQNLINKMFEPVLLTARRAFEPDLNVSLSGAAYEFIQMIVSLRKAASIKQTNTALNYILKNTLNDILIRSEEIPDILFGAVKESDAKVNSMIVILLIALCSNLLALIVCFVHMEVVYSKSKSRFVNLILRSEEKDIDMNIGRLREYVKSLGENLDDQKFAQLSTRMFELNAAINSTKKLKHKIKRVDSKGTDKQSIIRLLKLITLLLLCLVPSFTLFHLFLGYVGKIDMLVSNLIQNENILSKYILNFISVYEYVSLNSTSKVRNQPIQSQLDKDFQFLKDNFNFYDLIDTGDETNNKRLSALISGNLCDLLKAEIDYNPNCLVAGEGSASSGIYGMTSYLTRVMNRMQLEYEASVKDAPSLAQIMGLKQLRDAEMMIDIIFKEPFFEIDSILIDSINIQTELFQSEAVVIDCFIVLGCVLFAWLAYKVYYIGGLEERTKYRMILKLFPPRLVKSQGKIRNYLNSDHRNMFDM